MPRMSQSEKTRLARVEQVRVHFLDIMRLNGFTTQRSLATAMRVHENALSQILNGRRVVADYEANRMARLLKMKKAVLVDIFKSTSPAT